MLLVKEGVRFKNLMPQVLTLLVKLEILSRQMKVDITITSGNDGQHSKNSYHGKDLAIDIRDRNLTDAQIDRITSKLNGTAWKGFAGFYDVVHEKKKKRIHAEFDQNRWNQAVAKQLIRPI